jgi:hypothetical protein
VPILIFSAGAFSLRRDGKNSLLPGSSAPTNRALDHELSRAALMRTLHQRDLDKRQTPCPGEAYDVLTCLLESFVIFLCRPRGSVYVLEDEPERGSRSSRPRQLQEVWLS